MSREPIVLLSVDNLSNFVVLRFSSDQDFLNLPLEMCSRNVLLALYFLAFLYKHIAVRQHVGNISMVFPSSTSKGMGLYDIVL